MRRSAVTRLRDGHTGELSRAWGDGVDAAAELVRQRMFDGASLLPLTILSESRVYPIVIWDETAFGRRQVSLAGPVLDPAAVRGMLEMPQPVPSPLRIVGFVGVGPLSRVRGELAALRALGRTMAMVPIPTTSRKGSLQLAEFDAQGTAVIATDARSVEVLVGGDSGPRANSNLLPVWRRFYEEQLFGWALHTGCLPKA